MDDHLFILYIYYYLIFIIHFLLTSQFKLKLYKSERRYSYAIARSVGFCSSIDSLSKNFRAVRRLDGILSFAQCDKKLLNLNHPPPTMKAKGEEMRENIHLYTVVLPLFPKAFNFGEHTFIRLYNSMTYNLVNLSNIQFSLKHLHIKRDMG